MAYTPPPGANPYVNHSGNPLRAAAAPARRAIIPQDAALGKTYAKEDGIYARDVVAVVHHTSAGDIVEYNTGVQTAAVAAPAIRKANPPHGGGTYAFQKR